MVLEGLGVLFSATLGAIEALGVLFNDHWVVLEGPGWCSMVHYSGVHPSVYKSIMYIV